MMAVNFLKRMGTKTKLAQEVIKHFPPHDIYIENFFGAGGVFFNKPLAKKNFLNDNCKPLIELFETATNKGEELVEALEHSPYSQRLFNHFRDTSPDTCEFMKNDDVLRAVRFLYLSNYSFLGTGETMKIGIENNKQTLLKNLKEFLGSDYIKNTTFTSHDFRKFFDVMHIRNESEKQRSFLYSDPPYFKTENMYGEDFEKIKWKEQDVLDLFEAKTNFITKMVYFRQDVYDDMENPRNLFTAVHELGHIQLHTDTMTCLNRTSHEYKLKYEGKIYCDIEWQADTFGNLFLVPLKYLKQYKDKTIKEIKEIFGVSEPVAMKALKGLNDLLAKGMI